MKFRLTISAATIAGVAILAGAKPAHKLDTAKKAPVGLSKAITAVLSSEGHRVSGKKGAVCEVWLVKSLAVVPNFKPTLSSKYPLKAGQFVGVLRVGKGQTYTDFRGQELKAGVYTMRYGKQPEDGNHIGTSDLADFLLALPARIDKDPKTINLVDMLHMRSAKSSGGTHPAIFSLLPGTKATKTMLTHDDDKEFWILTTVAAGKSKDKAVKVPLRIVVIGKSAE